RPRRAWLFSVTRIPVLYSILILALRYHEVSEMCKPMGGRPVLQIKIPLGRPRRRMRSIVRPVKTVMGDMQRRALLKLAALSTIGLARAQARPYPYIHTKEPITMNDVIIIGGSFAGLAGALQLGRARRKVTVLDTGLPRNRFASHSHGLLGHDHKPPLEILAEARQQLARYPTIRLVNARADSI